MKSENKLQARIDVPLSEASKLFIGQEVEIACSMLPDTHFKGKLSRILGEADFQRNTLQVKVQILDPDLRLRPEMLCRAKFFSQKKNRRGDIFTKTKSDTEVLIELFSKIGNRCFNFWWYKKWLHGCRSNYFL